MRLSVGWRPLALLAGLLGAGTTWAQEAPGGAAAISAGDTVWVLLSAALVMLMTPGLAFFYGGMVRRKNVLSILMQCFFVLCLISVQWMVMGYSLAFGTSWHGFVGGFDWLGLKGVGLTPNADYAATIPHQAFMIFQMMFAVITPAVILGAFAERMRFGAFCVFSLLWATIVYDPVAHWVWGKGGLLGLTGGLGVYDFAGGLVVEINSGMAALAAVLVMGRRRGFPVKMSPPHSLPFAVLGAGLLWFGWLGFNAGSALGANGLACNAFTTTHLAAAMAGLTWASLDWIVFKKPTMLGVITGSVAGLVAITPAAGFVSPAGSLLVGGGAAAICWFVVPIVKTRLGLDDSLDVFGVHGIGGIWGTIATGLLATKASGNLAITHEGLFYGGGVTQLLIQLKSVGLVMAYSFTVSLLLFKGLGLFMKLRATEEEERIGLDLTQHREVGYTVID